MPIITICRMDNPMFGLTYLHITASTGTKLEELESYGTLTSLESDTKGNDRFLLAFDPSAIARDEAGNETCFSEYIPRYLEQHPQVIEIEYDKALNPHPLHQGKPGREKQKGR